MSSDLIYPWIRQIRQTRECPVLHIDLKPNETTEQQAVRWLCNNELQRVERLQVDRSQREFVLCRSALRYLLCCRHECKNSQLSIATTNHGKPYALVSGSRVTTQFSVSHSGNHGLIAIAEKGVGIDVEVGSPKKDYIGIAKKVFGSNEYSEIQSLDGVHRKNYFLRIWTFKESIVKAIGTGLRTNLAEFEIPPELRHGSRKGIIEFPADSGAQWILEDLSTIQYTAAIASEVACSNGLNNIG